METKLTWKARGEPTSDRWITSNLTIDVVHIFQGVERPSEYRRHEIESSGDFERVFVDPTPQHKGDDR